MLIARGGGDARGFVLEEWSEPQGEAVMRGIGAIKSLEGGSDGPSRPVSRDPVKPPLGRGNTACRAQRRSSVTAPWPCESPFEFGALAGHRVACARERDW